MSSLRMLALWAGNDFNNTWSLKMQHDVKRMVSVGTVV